MGITILKEISEAEAKIEKSRLAAEKKAKDMIAGAEADANKRIDDQKKQLEAQHKTRIASVKVDVEKEKEQKVKDAESQVSSLKEKAASKRSEAVDYVYSEFLNQFN